MWVDSAHQVALNGGKHYLAPKVVALMPRHRHYVEPYGGGASVLLERDPNDESLWWGEKSGQAGVSEVLNDLNGDLMNFWRVLRDKDSFAEFSRRCQATPLSREDFDRAGEIAEDFDVVNVGNEVVRAWAFFVRARQSRSGGFKGFTSLTRSRTRRGINGNASEWLGAVEGLAAIHARLQPVVLENMDALKLIAREDDDGTLFYLDPPYLHSTRATKDAYAHEMTEGNHFALLNLLAGVRGKFLLSGYHSELYDSAAALHGWRLYEFDLANHAAGGASKRRMVECLWCNF